MRQIISLRLSPETLRAARDAADHQGRTLTSFIERAVRNELEGGHTTLRALRAVTALRAHRLDLARLGVQHAAVFGSVARGEDTAASDLDIVIETDPAKVRSLITYGSIQQYLEEWLHESVDVSERRRLPTHIADAAAREQLIAF